jgi:hypothetical protein
VLEYHSTNPLDTILRLRSIRLEDRGNAWTGFQRLASASASASAGTSAAAAKKTHTEALGERMSTHGAPLAPQQPQRFTKEWSGRALGVCTRILVFWTHVVCFDRRCGCNHASTPSAEGRPIRFVQSLLKFEHVHGKLTMTPDAPPG